MPGTRVQMEIAQGDTDWGKIELELADEKTPETVRNFVEYVQAGFLDGKVFHRVIPGFMVQGGGYGPDMQPVRAGLRPPIQNEAASGLKNKRGTIAMARTAEPHSATAQFFINVSDNDFLDHPGQDGWGYCAFGEVKDGMDVVDRIVNVETVANPAMGEQSQPRNAPVIRKASCV